MTGTPNPKDISTRLQKIATTASWVAMILEAVYEQDFLDCSYGFRPGRSQHQALEALRQQAMAMGGCWVVEMDIKSFFDTMGHVHLREILQGRGRRGDRQTHRQVAELLGHDPERWTNHQAPDDEKASGAGCPSHLGVVPKESPRACDRATQGIGEQGRRSLPVLRHNRELSLAGVFLEGRRASLALLSQSTLTASTHDMGAFHPAAAATGFA